MQTFWEQEKLGVFQTSQRRLRLRCNDKCEMRTENEVEDRTRGAVFLGHSKDIEMYTRDSGRPRENRKQSGGKV